MAHAGLLDPNGTFNDYVEVQDLDQGWSVAFRTFACNSSATCELHPSGNTHIEVFTNGTDLNVVAISGPITDSDRQDLLGYSETATAEEFGLEFPYITITGTPDEGVSIIAAPLWTGIIPTDGRARCDLKVLSESDVVLYERPLQEPAPTSEGMRSGTMHIFGVPDELRTDAARARIACAT